MKKFLGFIICGLIIVGCSHKESKDIIEQDSQILAIAKDVAWEESEQFTSENLSLIGESQL